MEADGEGDAAWERVRLWDQMVEEHGVVNVSRDGRIGIVELSYPSKGNAIVPPMYRMFVEAMRELSMDDDVWAIVIRGKGKSFSTGGYVGHDAFYAGLDAGQGRLQGRADAAHVRRDVPARAARGLQLREADDRPGQRHRDGGVGGHRPVGGLPHRVALDALPLLVRRDGQHRLHGRRLVAAAADRAVAREAVPAHRGPRRRPAGLRRRPAQLALQRRGARRRDDEDRASGSRRCPRSRCA